MRQLLWMVCLMTSLLAHAEQSGYEDYLLGAGDTIHINVYSNPELVTDTRVSAAGTVTFPWVGEVKVAGLNTAQAEREIATLLSKKGYIIDPQVSVTIVTYDSQTFSILGNVAKPGKYPLDRPITLTEALAIAGGVIPIAASDIITIMSVKDGTSTKHNYDLRDFFINGNSASNPKVLPHDVVFVPNYPVFYIYGEVQKPSAYKLERNMTVSQALATGGGFTLRATKKYVKIERTNSEGVTTKIEAHPQDLLQANDVLYIEESLF